MSRATAYLRPSTLADLWAALDDAGRPVRVSAGCTDLIPQARAGQLEPAPWIDLRRIPELTVFEGSDDELRLGAAVTHHQVATSAEARDLAPALASACHLVLTPAQPCASHER